MSLFDSFLVRAAFGGLGVALAAGPSGCFVVWRRMAYFGDATAHAAILGVAVALGADLPVFAGALVMALGMALGVTFLAGRTHSSDTLLGVLSHGALAVGLVAVSLIGGIRIDLMSFLFGDILAVSKGDLALIWGGAVLVVGLLAWRWQAMLTATLNPDLAHAAGLNPQREQLVLTLALAIVVAFAIKVVGVLLIAALLLIPTAAARPFASTPERMAVAASSLGALSVLAGLWVSYQFDTPTGPSIVTTAMAMFVVSTLLPPILRLFRG